MTKSHKLVKKKSNTCEKSDKKSQSSEKQWLTFEKKVIKSHKPVKKKS